MGNCDSCSRNQEYYDNFPDLPLLSPPVTPRSNNNDDSTPTQHKFAVFVCAPGFEKDWGSSYGDVMIDFFTNIDEKDELDPDKSLLTHPCLNSIRNPSNWSKFHCYKGHVPTLYDINGLKGIVITGSGADAHDLVTDWIISLRNIIYQIWQKTGINYGRENTTQRLHKIKLRKDFKMIGICFGHQITSNSINKSCGTGRNPIGWEIGMKQINLTNEFKQLINYYHIKKDPFGDGYQLFKNFMKRVEDKGKLNINKMHRDCVNKTPSNGKIVATSNKTKCEWFTVNGNILGIQGHPEYSNEYVNMLCDNYLKLGKLDEITVKNAKESMKGKKADRLIFQKICLFWLAN